MVKAGRQRFQKRLGKLSRITKDIVHGHTLECDIDESSSNERTIDTTGVFSSVADAVTQEQLNVKTKFSYPAVDRNVENKNTRKSITELCEARATNNLEMSDGINFLLNSDFQCKNVGGRKLGWCSFDSLAKKTDDIARSYFTVTDYGIQTDNAGISDGMSLKMISKHKTFNKTPNISKYNSLPNKTGDSIKCFHSSEPDGKWFNSLQVCNCTKLKLGTDYEPKEMKKATSKRSANVILDKPGNSNKNVCSANLCEMRTDNLEFCNCVNTKQSCNHNYKEFKGNNTKGEKSDNLDICRCCSLCEVQEENETSACRSFMISDVDFKETVNPNCLGFCPSLQNKGDLAIKRPLIHKMDEVWTNGIESSDHTRLNPNFDYKDFKETAKIQNFNTLPNLLPDSIDSAVDRCYSSGDANELCTNIVETSDNITLSRDLKAKGYSNPSSGISSPNCINIFSNSFDGYSKESTIFPGIDSKPGNFFDRQFAGNDEAWTCNIDTSNGVNLEMHRNYKRRDSIGSSKSSSDSLPNTDDCSMCTCPSPNESTKSYQRDTDMDLSFLSCSSGSASPKHSDTYFSLCKDITSSVRPPKFIVPRSKVVVGRSHGVKVVEFALPIY